MFFSADDSTHGTELFASNASGTTIVKDINPSGGSGPDQLTNINGTLFFSADDGVNGRQLWIAKVT